MKFSAYQNHKPLARLFNLNKLKLLVIFLTLSTIILITSYSWNGLSTLTIGGKEYTSKESSTEEPDYWTWNTITRFVKNIDPLQSNIRNKRRYMP